MATNMTNRLNYMIYTSIVLLALFVAFRYQVAWYGDILEALIQVKKIEDVGFLANDYYVNTFDSFSPRLSIGYFIYILSNLFNIEYSYMVAILNILRLTSMFILSFLFIEIIIKNKVASLLAVFLISLNFYGFPKVPVSFFSPDLNGHALSLNFILLSLYLIFRNQINFSFLILSIALFFHPVLALNSLLLFILFIYIKRNELAISYTKINKKLFILNIIFFLSVFLLYFIKHKLELSGAYLLNGDEFINILYNFRHPYYLVEHYSIFNIFHYIVNIIIYVKMMNYLYESKYINLKIKELFKIFLYIWILYFVFAFISIEILHIKLIATLMPYRFLYFFTFFFMSLYGLFLLSKIRNHDILSIVLLLLPFVPQITNNNAYVSFAYLGVLISMYMKSFDIIKWNSKNIFTDKFIIIIIFCLSTLLLSYSANKFHLEIPSIETEDKIYSYIKNKLPKDALIFVDIESDNIFFINNKVRFLTNHSVIIDGSFPFLEKYWIEWKARYLDIRKSNPTEKYIPYSDEKELYSICKKYNINYIFRDKILLNKAYFKMEFKTKNYEIYEVK
jgi:hypothetical protein